MIPSFGFSLSQTRLVQIVVSIPQLINWLFWGSVTVFLVEQTTQFNNHPLFWTPIGVVLGVWFWRDVGQRVYAGTEFEGVPWHWRALLNMLGAFAVYVTAVTLDRVLPALGVLHDAMVMVLATGVAFWVAYQVTQAEERLMTPDGHAIPPGLRNWLRNIMG